MRKSKKFYLGMLVALVMACMIAVPTIAAEYDADVQSLTEPNAEVQEDPADEADDLTQGLIEESQETPDDVDIPTQETGWEGVNEASQEEDTEVNESSQEEEETSDIDLLNEDAEEPEEDEEENAIATLAVTNGFGQGEDGNWYYYVNGKIATDTNSVIQDKDKQIDDTASWWYVVGGKVQTDFTGLADYSNASGWWYINEGKVTFDFTGLAQNKNGMFYVEDSKVNFNYDGFESDGSKWLYVEKGKVTYKTNSVIQDTGKKINGSSDWWYVIGSEVQSTFTGLADYSNSNGWWYIEEGRVTFNYEGVEHNKNGWWYVKDSKVQFNYNGFGENSNGKWYIESGKVTFNKNSVIQDTTGAIGTKGTWWYVVGSKVQTGFTGLADYSNSNGWWYINNGKVTFDFTGYAQNKNGWYHVVNSKVDFSQCGVIYTTVNGIKDWWYIDGGKVMTSYTGVANYSNSNGWWYVKNGRVDFSYSGVAKNNNGWWYVNGGKVLFEDCLTYAAQFVGANTSTSQSNDSKLATCFNVLWSQYSYVRTYDSPSASVMSQYAVDMFKNHRGNCYRYAASFACIAKVLGYDVRVAVGQISSASGGMTPHGWTEVYSNGQWLICDPDMQMNYPNINSYMRTESNYAYRHTCSARYTLTISSGTVVWK